MWPFSKNIPDLEKLAKKDDKDLTRLAGRRLLEMVGELHSRGYEGLRICPHTAPSGLSWRCWVVPRARMRSACEFDSDKWHELEPKATYSSGKAWEPFGWPGVGAQTAAQWADRFQREFPQTCEEGRQSDPAYAAWYREMLAGTQNLVTAWDDSDAHDPLHYYDAEGNYPTPPF